MLTQQKCKGLKKTLLSLQTGTIYNVDSFNVNNLELVYGIDTDVCTCALSFTALHLQSKATWNLGLRVCKNFENSYIYANCNLN